MLDIKESIGMCFCCGNVGVLGDGICQECWDKGDSTELTEREKEVLFYLSIGLENNGIAGKMFVGRSTIEFHIHSLKRKFPIPNGFNKRVWLAQNTNKILGGNGHGSLS